MMIAKLILYMLLASLNMDFSEALDWGCGRSLTHGPQRYIYGGRLAGEGEFPWMVREFIIHKGYDTRYKNDIALLRLREPFDLKKSQGHIGTVCLPTEHVKPKTTFTLSGWGRLSKYGLLPNLLRAVAIKVRPNSFCRIGEVKFIPRTMFCAGNNEKDACDADSGSPAVQRKRGVAFQVGIVSFGGPCGEDHTYYTRVFSYRKWIDSNIKRALDV